VKEPASEGGLYNSLPGVSLAVRIESERTLKRALR
jgi:hypothetical protein